MPQSDTTASPAELTQSNLSRLMGLGGSPSDDTRLNDSPKRLRPEGVERALSLEEEESAEEEAVRSDLAKRSRRTLSWEAIPAPAPAAEPVECAICCSAMEDPAVGGGCAHHFCLTCLESWAKTKPSCPTCRAPIWSITRDVEFANLIGADTSCSRNKSAAATPGGEGEGEGEGEALLQTAPPPRIKSGIRIFAPAGVTIATNGTGDCVVTRVIKGNGFDQAGVHVGDVVIAVNGTAVRDDHSHCIEFIERRCRVGDCEITYKAASTGPLLRMTSAFRSSLPQASLTVSRMASRVRRQSGLVPRRTPAPPSPPPSPPSPPSSARSPLSSLWRSSHEVTEGDD